MKKTKTIGEIAKSHGYDNVKDYFDNVMKAVNDEKAKSPNIGDLVKWNTNAKRSKFDDPPSFLDENKIYEIVEKEFTMLHYFSVKLKGIDRWVQGEELLLQKNKPKEMKYIIVDLEATCWDGKNGNRNEIIEIGAVKLDENGDKIDEFCSFVKPKFYPKLSYFCKSLTSITQEDVDIARDFPTVLKEFQKWIGDEDYFLCSWGFYDKSQFTKDCKLHDLDTAWLNNHMSVKHQYKAIKSLKKGIGMKKALQKESIELEGTHHRGIDDARNIAKIFKVYLNEFKFE